MTQYRVVGERILVLRDPEKESGGGLVMTEDLKKPPLSGTVLSVGDKCLYTKTGDRVHFSEYAGHYVRTADNILEESSLIVMREDEVIVYIEEETDASDTA